MPLAMLDASEPTKFVKEARSVVNTEMALTASLEASEMALVAKLDATVYASSAFEVT
jgi:hypothetical protein